METTDTILIVDDEKNLRSSLSKILNYQGYSVNTAANGQEALQYLQAGAYNLAFYDLMLPGMDGVTLIKETHKIYPDMPVLILTANATLESAIEAVRSGARDYLIKPVDPPLLIKRVKEILEEQQQPRRQREIINKIQTLASELENYSEDNIGVNIANIPKIGAADPTRILQRGEFQLDLHARHATLKNHFLDLSPANFDFLSTLVRHSPNPVSYQNLVQESQGYEVDRTEAQEMARWRIHELRKIIEPVPKKPTFIITVRGKGYRLVV